MHWILATIPQKIRPGIFRRVYPVLLTEVAEIISKIAPGMPIGILPEVIPKLVQGFLHSPKILRIQTGIQKMSSKI